MSTPCTLAHRRVPRPALFVLAAALALAGSLAGPALARASTESSPAPASAPQGEPAASVSDRTQAPGAVTTPSAESGLDSDLIYAVLVAELAVRRGQLDLAFTHYLHASQLAEDAEMAELAVRAAIAAEDDAAAGRGIAQWLRLAPDSVGAHQVAALLRIRVRDREGALTELSRVLELSGKDGGSGYSHVMGIVGRAATDDERIDLMQALVERDSANPEAQHALAMVAAAAQRNELAESAARRALVQRPGWSQPQIFLVRLLLAQEKRDEARDLLEDYVAASPDDRALRLLYGQFLVEEKELASARHEFEHLLGNQPKEPDVLFAVGILSLQLEDLDAARGYLTRLYQTGERQDEAAFYLGQVEERAERPEVAVDWYTKAGGANATDAQVRIALLRAKQGEVGRAREIVQQLRDQSPDDAQSLYLVEAEILHEVGLKDQALAVYGQALEAFPDNLDLLYARAMYEVRIERIPEAEQDLRRIIDKDPEHADALNALGYTLADRTTRYDEALELISRAHRLKPDEPAILDSMGWIHFRLGQKELALDYLRRALKAMDDGEIAAHLGEVLWSAGRQDEAWQVWDKALKTHPEHAYLLEVVGRHRVTKTEPNR